MAKGRMLVISCILTLSLATIGVMAIIFIGEASPLKQLNESTEKIASIDSIEAPVSSEVLADEGPETVGIRQHTDEYGLHDILFESATDELQGMSGPMSIMIKNRQLELLTPDNEAVRKSLEGRAQSTVALFEVDIINTAQEAVIFKVDDAKAVTDTGETAIVNAKLSTYFGSSFAAGETKSGVLAIDLSSKARDVAVVTLKILPAYSSATHDEIGEPVALKIPMY